MVAVVARLGRQIEGDGEACLALGKIGAIERIRGCRTRMARIGAENPGFVALSHWPVVELGLLRRIIGASAQIAKASPVMPSCG